MGAKLPFPVRPYTLKLYDGEPQELSSYYPRSVGASMIIRELVHQHLIMLRESASRSETQDVSTIRDLAQSVDLGDLGVSTDDGSA